MGSSRFPGKPLCNILGMTMIEHCYKRCELNANVSDIFVATCDAVIKKTVEGFGGTAIMTDPNISRPGVRVAEAAQQLNLNKNDVVVVVQGDEPLVHPKMIDIAIRPLFENENILVSNLCTELSSGEWTDPSEIKVVCDNKMNAMYMSRSPIPSTYHEEKRTKWWKQVCVMPFRWHFMKSFNYELKPTSLELQESIEMLRAIQHGYKVRMVPTDFVSKSVDTDKDRIEVENIMKNDKIYKEFINET